MIQSHLWLCHWEHLDHRTAAGPRPAGPFWICEHPYRTIRTDGPSEDCGGCPVWDAMQRDAARRARKKEKETIIVVSGRVSRGGGYAA